MANGSKKKSSKKSRTDREITPVKGVDPQLLQQYAEGDDSLEALKEFRVLPMLKVIQSMTDEGLKDAFGEGSVIIRPGDALVTEKNEPFLFVPQYFYNEFCKWSDRNDTENPSIVDRNHDPSSDLAKKARDPNMREEKYEEDAKKPDKDARYYRNVEHYHFPGVIYGNHELAGQPVILSFSRGEFRQGSNFINAISMRRMRVENAEGQTVSVNMPLWMQVWRLRPSLRDQGQRKWWGLDFEFPDPDEDEPSCIDLESEAEDFKAQYQEFRELHEANKLMADHDVVGEADAETDAADVTEEEVAEAEM